VSQREERTVAFQRQLDKQQKFIAKEEEYVPGRWVIERLAGGHSGGKKGV
jgi:hypothetical protein